MTCRTRAFLSLLAMIGAAQAGRLAAAEAPVLRAMTEHASPPFSFRDDMGQPQGFAVELIQAVAADQDFRVTNDLRPWQDIYADFQQGRGDILGLVAYSDERARRMDFSVPFEHLIGGFYARRGGPTIHKVADLRGRSIAVIRNAITHEYARAQDWSAEIRTFESLGDCLLAVDRGECDAMIGMQLVSDYEIKRLGLTRITRSGLALPGINYQFCFAVQPGQKELLARINLGLYRLHLNRRIEALHEKWLGELEPRQLRWRDLQPYLPLAALVAAAALGAFLWQRRLLTRLSRQARSIRENEERLQLVFEGSRDAFWDWDVARGHILRSPRWTGMLGYQPDEIGPGRDGFRALIHPADLDAILASEEQLRTGKDHFGHEFRLKAKSGDWKWILDRGKVVARDPVTGEPRRITGTHTDVTERKLAEAVAEKLHHKMQQTQKLESLGVMAGGVAHDFNNLLTVIIGNATLARLEAGESDANRERLESVILSGRHAADLCHQLLAYAGKGSFKTERINLNELITETIRLLEMSIGKKASLEFALAADLPQNEADASQIRQVIMNLVINAAEAFPGPPGTIRLATTAVTLGPPAPGESAAMIEVVPGDYVCLQVTDTGAGMTAEVLARIFDPFFTTKFTGRGLGLAAVLGIVRAHHGNLKVGSKPGQGSTFRIYLPIVQHDTVHPFAAMGGTQPPA